MKVGYTKTKRVGVFKNNNADKNFIVWKMTRINNKTFFYNCTEK